MQRVYHPNIPGLDQKVVVMEGERVKHNDFNV